MVAVKILHQPLRQIARRVVVDIDQRRHALPGRASIFRALLQPGAPWALCITPKDASGKQFLYASDAWPGRLYKLTLDGQVLGWLGGSGKQLKQFGWIHEIACPSENELYVGELLNWRLQKLTLHPK